MTHNLDRKSSEIAKELALIIHTRVNNPDVDNFTSVTEVMLSKDIKYATVFVLVPVGGDVDKTIKALQRSTGFIRHALSEAMPSLRVVPELNFKADTSEEYGSHIENILRKIKENNDDNRQ